jgi:hypothetical protein
VEQAQLELARRELQEAEHGSEASGGSHGGGIPVNE